MAVKILFFAHLRDIAQSDSIEIELGAAKIVRDLLTSLEGQVPNELVEELRDESALVSVNHKYAGWDGILSDGDEVGILPPVSGG
jgi:MoaD family protein